ncbi:hypothetical protein OHA25_17500 [Nonomuraea sp. NBC_00507]|uniref:sigma factor n=1 Tax=Nonomuraea sp. NBC_00507 TaxID=2976002 RepID=UPI002E19594E
MADGFANYVGQRHERLCRTAYLLTRDWAMAEDVVQHSLVKAWTVWPKIGDDPDRYVYRIIVNCADPQAWVLVRSVHDPGQWTDFGRCGERKGNILDSQNDAQSVPPGWLERPQGVEIWVFPADASIGSSAGCAIEDRKKGACNAPFDHETLTLAPELLANQIGPREGAPWWIGVYDTRQ